MPVRRHEQSTAIQAAGQRDVGGSVSPNATPGDLEWYHWLACSRVSLGLRLAAAVRPGGSSCQRGDERWRTPAQQKGRSGAAGTACWPT